MSKVWFWRRAGWEHMRPIVLLVLLALMLSLAAGCSFLATTPRTKAAPAREIVVECRDMIAEAEAPAESALGQVAPAAVAIVTALVGANPFGTVLAFMGGSAAITAIEQGKEGLYEIQTIRVPVAEGMSSCVVRDASGGIVILTGGATTKVDDALALAFGTEWAAGLTKEQIAFWRRIATTTPTEMPPQPPSVKPK